MQAFSVLQDEASSGLDAATALQTVGFVKKMIQIQGKTAVLAYQQTSQELFGQFDDLILIAEGKVSQLCKSESFYIHLTSHNGMSRFYLTD